VNDQYWGWLLSFVGVAGFLLAGRVIWWAWYVNIACQVLWFTYAIVTHQFGFFVGAIFYSCVFCWNAYKWTKAHFKGLDPARSNRYYMSNHIPRGEFVQGDIWINPQNNNRVRQWTGESWVDV